MRSIPDQYASATLICINADRVHLVNSCFGAFVRLDVGELYLAGTANKRAPKRLGLVLRWPGVTWITGSLNGQGSEASPGRQVAKQVGESLGSKVAKQSGCQAAKTGGDITGTLTSRNLHEREHRLSGIPTIRNSSDREIRPVKLRSTTVAIWQRVQPAVLAGPSLVSTAGYLVEQ